MNIYQRILLALSVTLVLGTLAVSAATPEWSYDGTFAIIYQVVSDGKGGCGVYGVQTNGNYHVAWLDKHGDVIYQRSVAPGDIIWNIYGVTRKAIVFGLQTGAGAELISVDKSGTQSGTPFPVNSLYFQVGLPPYGTSITQDKKGYFFPLRDLLTGIFTLERYSYK